jgi:hypothetical protein
MGRPRERTVAQIRWSTRAEYHRDIWRVIKNEIVRNKIAESLLEKRDRDFWSEVMKIKGRGRRVP